MIDIEATFPVAIEVPCPVHMGEYALWLRDFLAWFRDNDLRSGDWNMGQYNDGKTLIRFQEKHETLAVMCKLRWG